MGYGLALLNGIELGGFGSFLGLGLLWTWIELGEFDVWLGLFSYWLGFNKSFYINFFKIYMSDNCFGIWHYYSSWVALGTNKT